jgi:hypothetical protein
MIRPAQQQTVDRAEEQEGRVLTRPALGSQVEQLIMNRDGPAQGPVQRRGRERSRVLKGVPQFLPVQHQPSLTGQPSAALMAHA